MDKKKVELEIIEVWGTIDKEGVYPYVNIYDIEAEARKEIGTKQDGLEIVDVLKGWFITGTEDTIDSISNDFYFTIEEAKDDLNERIIPAHVALGFHVVVKELTEVEVFEVLDSPLSFEEILKRKDENNIVEGVIAVALETIISTELEGFLDILSDKLVDGSLYNIGYTIVGHQDETTLLLKVSGDVTSLIEQMDEGDE